MTQRRLSIPRRDRVQFAPSFGGHNREKLDLFRMNKDIPKSNPKDRYPLGRYPCKVYISFGKIANKSEFQLRLNSNQAILNSSDKIKTKELLRREQIPVMDHVSFSEFIVEEDDGMYVNITPLLTSSVRGWPLIAKPKDQEAGKGVKLLKNITELNNFISQDTYFGENANQYILEKYFKHTKELRFHVTPWLTEFTAPNAEKFKHGVFSIQLFQRRGESLLGKDVTYTTHHNLSDEVKNKLSKIASKAINAIGLDFGAVDFLLNDEEDEFVVGEINSNPYLSTDGTHSAPGYMIQVYRNALSKIILNKGIERGLINTEALSTALNTTNQLIKIGN